MTAIQTCPQTPSSLIPLRKRRCRRLMLERLGHLLHRALCCERTPPIIGLPQRLQVAGLRRRLLLALLVSSPGPLCSAFCAASRVLILSAPTPRRTGLRGLLAVRRQGNCNCIGLLLSCWSRLSNIAASPSIIPDISPRFGNPFRTCIDLTGNRRLFQPSPSFFLLPLRVAFAAKEEPERSEIEHKQRKTAARLRIFWIFSANCCTSRGTKPLPPLSDR